jgi:hypothetical protein
MSPEFIMIATAGLVLYYLREKAKNLATKDDIGAITREVELAKLEFRMAEELWRRQSRVHEMQVQALIDLYTHLQEVRETLVSATRAAKWAGDNYAKAVDRLEAALGRTEAAITKCILLLPPALVGQVEEYRQTVYLAIVAANEARNAPAHGVPSTPFLTDAFAGAQKTEMLLSAIQIEARAVIYGRAAAEPPSRNHALEA